MAAGIPGQGTWKTTLQARDLDGNAANGPEAYYDTALNITWLADANYAGTTGYVSSTHGPGGNMVFGEALLFTGSLNIGGVVGWRLPSAVVLDGKQVDAGSSELAHLFNVTLGNSGSLTNTGPFANLVGHRYWMESANTPDAIHFDTTDGSMDALNAFKDMPDRVWAVHTGDVFSTLAVPAGGSVTPSVPEPDAAVLAFGGMACLGLIARRKARR